MIQYNYLTYYQLYVVKSNYSRKGKRDTGGVHFMDSKAFFKLSYGVYIISTSADGRESGCVINTLTQVTSSPARLSIALNKENYTFKLIETSGTFSAVVLSDDVEMDLIRRFGFQCGKDVENTTAFHMDGTVSIIHIPQKASVPGSPAVLYPPWTWEPI